MKVRMARARIVSGGLIAVAVALTSAAVGLLAVPAGAAPSTKWYIATVGQTTTSLASYAVYPPSTPETLYLRIANDPTSNQAFGSADIDLRTDTWGWDPSSLLITTSNRVEDGWAQVSGFDSTNHHLIHLRNDGVGSQYAIPPGESLTVQVNFTTPAGGSDAPGLVVKQSNDFSDSSTRNTSNVFGTQAAAPAIYVGSGPPAKIVYTQNPSDVQVTTGTNDTHYMCPPVKAAVEDGLGNIVSWLPSTSVTLSSTGTPGLKLNGGSTLSANTLNGVATFGAGDTTAGCTAGLTATNQGSYQLTATTTVAAGAGYPSATYNTAASTFTVYLTLCGATCDVPLTGDQTTAGIHATGGDGTSTPLIGLISLAGTDPSGCVNAHITYRPSQTTVFLEGHDKSVDIGWSKKVTNLDPRNGTPFWPVCIVAPYSVYVSDGAGGATLGDATNGAILVLCNTSGVKQRVTPALPGPDHACVSNLYKNAASEHAVVWVPDEPGDPQFK